MIDEAEVVMIAVVEEDVDALMVAVVAAFEEVVVVPIVGAGSVEALLMAITAIAEVLREATGGDSFHKM